MDGAVSLSEVGGGGGGGGGGALGKVSDPDLDLEMRGKTEEAPRKNFARPFAPFIVFQVS